MYIPLPKEEKPIVLTPEEQEKHYFQLIRFESHKFVEINHGIAKCEFCGLHYNKNMVGIGIIPDIKLCFMNPHLFPADFLATIKLKQESEK